MFHGDAIHPGHGLWREMAPGKKALMILRWVLLAAVGLALAGLVVMLLWNRIMATVLGLPILGFWEAIGLFLLAKLLFGGRGGSFFARMRMRRVMRERMATRAEDGEGRPA